MKALVKAHAAPGLWLQDVPEPTMGEDDVLIRIKCTSICGTDVHIYEWDEWAQKTIKVPLVIGHEYSGVIEAVGSKVTHLKPGQKVSGEGHLVEMYSRNSRAGRFHLDPHTRGVGIHRPGGFAEYLRLPAFNVIPLPDSIDFEIGAILDPFGNAVHAALSFDLVGEDVLITGAGPIGIMAAAVARHAGARHIVITDLNDTRLELAASMVDVRPMNVKREVLRDVMAELGMHEGFDIGLEMSGSPAAFDEMVEVMIMGGRIALLGIPSQKALVDWSKIIFKALTIKAIYGREMFETWYKMLAILSSGLNLRPIITHHFPVERFEAGFHAMQSGEAGKVILAWA
ncbi:MAG: L-threonine 3-dehydrogenase [Anaerolineales bacterium]|nr:L-threonine 3-dehydrogenase [Anaerolineales bacterium]